MSRPLSERAHRKILDAATELFAERGIDVTSVDAIAAAAGVSKATIYNHWADKDDLCLAVLTHAFRTADQPPQSDTGDLAKDLVTLLCYEPTAETEALLRRLSPHLAAYAARHPEFGKAWRARAMEPKRAAVRRLLRRGIEQGILPAVFDEDLGIALLIGPMTYRHVFAHSLDKKWLAAGAVDALWRAFARPDASPAGRKAPRPVRSKNPTRKAPRSGRRPDTD